MSEVTGPQQLSDNTCIAVVGLGYVGLPLAVEFGKHFPTKGFDIADRRIRELQHGEDSTLEVQTDELINTNKLTFTSTYSDLSDVDVFVVTVPTPVDIENRPDLSALKSASEIVGSVIRAGNVVIYESTVYPGATEEICLPIIEKISGLRLNTNFFAGYSPERINPGDKSHRLPDITKVTSGSNSKTRDFVDTLYRKIIVAGTHSAPSIRVAEAAKVIENTQRDLNIALINELSMIFDKLEIDTEAVLTAAATKWNFLQFKPGLVGGHCIGVDPYYLTHRAQQAGYQPQVILAGRRINDGMARHVADRVIRLMQEREVAPKEARMLVMGLTFKENCPDTRNTQVIELIQALREYGNQIDVFDPWVSRLDQSSFEINFVEIPEREKYDAIVIAVAHETFRELGARTIQSFSKPNGIIFDVKHMLPADQTTARL